MADVKFVDGMRVTRRDNAPDWVVASLGLQREKLIAWLQQQEGDWVNVDIKRSQKGSYYAAVDEYKKRQSQGDTSFDPDNF